MALLALAEEQGTVTTSHGCDTTTKTLEGSSTVFGPGGYKIVRKGDKEKIHEYPNPGSPPPACINHQLELDTGESSTVFIDGSKEAAMVGSEYGGAEEITNAGQTTVFVT